MLAVVNMFVWFSSATLSEY